MKALIYPTTCCPTG